MKLSEIIQHLPQLQLFGPDVEVVGISPSHTPKPNTIVYSPTKGADRLSGIILTAVENASYLDSNTSALLSSNPRRDLAYLTHIFKKTEAAMGISPLSSIHPSAVLGQNVTIHPYVYIGPNTVIGDNCTIYSGTVIGGDGFGYEKMEDNTWLKMEHLGGVRIGNDVEIGANTCIDRGTLGDTIIEDGVKIDNLVHIAHNVHIERNSMIIANAMVAGSVRIKANTWIAPSSSIREGLHIGENSLVGLGAVVTKSVPANTIVIGNPAKPKE